MYSDWKSSFDLIKKVCSSQRIEEKEKNAGRQEHVAMHQQ